MGYFNYHAKHKKRIENKELVGYKFVLKYNKNISEALVLLFNTYPQIVPIRPYRYEEYLPLLEGVKEHEESITFG